MKNLEVALWCVPLSSPFGAGHLFTQHFKVSKTQYDRVWSYIESGKKEGARVIVGGEKRTTPGYWVDATSARAFPPECLNANSWGSIYRHSL